MKAALPIGLALAKPFQDSLSGQRGWQSGPRHGSILKVPGTGKGPSPQSQANPVSIAAAAPLRMRPAGEASWSTRASWPAAW
jgi:hypothetical protein